MLTEYILLRSAVERFDAGSDLEEVISVDQPHFNLDIVPNALLDSFGPQVVFTDGRSARISVAGNFTHIDGAYCW